MITVKPYSDKGLAVHGCTPEQAEEIRAALGAAVVTQYNAKLGGWLFSRKREQQIRGLVAAMNAGDMPEQTPCARIGFDGEPCGRIGFHQHDHPARIHPAPQTDSMPGEWGVLAERANASA